MATSTIGAIVIADHELQGIKLEDATVAKLKIIPGITPHSSTHVLRGELLLEMKQENDHRNYYVEP